MSISIVHLATDAIAGMPYRLVNILQNHTSFNVRLVETKQREAYPQDLVFGKDKDIALELIKKADIIHFHNNIDLESKAFSTINFKELKKKGTRFVRQFHSVPSTIARKMNCSVESVLSDPIPSIVIGQFQERYYPNALVVPNSIPINDPLYMPFDGELNSDILFTPSKKISAWSDRWNTKGMPETMRMLKNIEKLTGCKTKVVTNSPLHKVLYEKQRSYMVIEEMITGSYHLSGLEGLSMGKPTLCYLDKRTEFVMKYLSGSDTIPFINTMMEHSHEVLQYLLSDRNTGKEIGLASRKWMEFYWSEEALVPHFVEMYNNLIINPTLVSRQPDLEIGYGKKYFDAIKIHDLLYSARKERNYTFNLKSFTFEYFKKYRKKIQRFITGKK